MKKSMRLLIALACLGSLTLPVLAENKSAASTTPAGTAAAPEMRQSKPERRLEHMTRELNLTEAQRQQLQPILNEENQEMQALRQDKSLARDARREKAKAIHDKYEPKINGVLTAEQRTKREKSLADWKARWQQRRKERMEKKQSAQAAPQAAAKPATS